MEKEQIIRLTWHGRATVEEISDLLQDVEAIEIALAPNFNHALFHRLHPGETTAGVEEIHASGGPELLATIASIRGLEEFEALSGVLAGVPAGVRIESPPKVLIEMPDTPGGR